MPFRHGRSVAALSLLVWLSASFLVLTGTATADEKCVDGSRSSAAAVGRDSVVEQGQVMSDDQFPATVSLRYSPTHQCAWALISGHPDATAWIDRQADEAKTWRGPLGQRNIQSGNTTTYTAAFSLDGAKVRACGNGFHDNTTVTKVLPGPIVCTPWFDPDVPAGGASSAATPYTALGDSYASGEGAKTFISGTDEHGQGCHRSTTSWAFQVSRDRRLDVAFVACSGAQIEDLYDFNAGSGTVWQEPQIRGVAPDHTQLVTLSIGGNNVDFAGIVQSCVTGVHSGGSGGCRTRNEEKTKTALAGLRDGTASAPSLAIAYTDVAKRIAPGGKLIVTGYPELFGDDVARQPNGTGTCQLGTLDGAFIYTVDEQDMYWMNDEANTLNDVIREAVQTASATTPQVSIVFAPVSDHFAGHRLCDTGDSWINGIQFYKTGPKQMSLHPDSDGQQAYAAAIRDADSR